MVSIAEKLSFSNYKDPLVSKPQPGAEMHFSARLFEQFKVRQNAQSGPGLADYKKRMIAEAEIEWIVAEAEEFEIEINSHKTEESARRISVYPFKR